MRFTRSDIVEDVLAHIRELGGDFSEWCVGTARDREALLARSKAVQLIPDQTKAPRQAAIHCPTAASHSAAADLAKASGPAEQHVATDLGEGLIWREAYTPYAAADVAERLADCGLRLECNSVSTPGYIVFVYRPTTAAPAAIFRPRHHIAA